MWLTHIGEIVHQDDLLEQVGRGSVQHRVHRPEEYRPRLIVETDDNWRGRKILQVTTRLLAPATEHLDETVFTPNLSPCNRTSGWHRVHIESWHQQQTFWITPCSHRILTPATEPLDDTVFTPNPSTSNITSGWQCVYTESFHQPQNFWMTVCSHRILPPATEPLDDNVFTPNSSTCNTIPVPVE